MNRYFKFYALSIVLIGFLSACHQAEPETEETPEAIIPVQVTTASDSAMTTFIDVTAVSTYLEKSFIKANINGYVQASYAETGKMVGSGTLLFSLITKEARSIGNTINKLDPNLKFSGISNLTAAKPGLIALVNHQKGDYVQDGEALATISNSNSLVFLLDLPYEYNRVIQSNKNLIVELPDGEKLKGIVTGAMSTVDSLAQTQRYIIKVNSAKEIPEGLVGKVRLVKLDRPNAQVLPKLAVLSNETEEEFWVMKLINDSTAIKVKIEKGIESGNLIEILKPKFGKTDRFVTTGNYGMADTAKVKILK